MSETPNETGSADAERNTLGTPCAACGTATEADRITAIRGLRDVHGIALVCRRCLPVVRRRGALRPLPAPVPVSVGARMAALFGADR